MGVEIFLDREKAERIKQIRPTKDEYFMLIAKLVSLRATCPRLRSGQLLLRTDTSLRQATTAPPGAWSTA